MKKNGFTLVETLVAIVILMVAIVGPLYVAEATVNASHVAQDNLTASFLAQEAIEMVRATRDTNYDVTVMFPDHPQDWLSGLEQCESQQCTADALQDALAACNGTCTPLYLNTQHLYTQQQSGAVTPFTRTLTLTPGGDDHTENISVTVSWSSTHVTHTIILQDTISNWLQ